jgi:hypothetical protein|uniref:Uncharacterized protein n=1 Tax=Thermodesulfobium narugense TaxID=184064 RepID=A0A7C5KB03_9BACT
MKKLKGKNSEEKFLTKVLKIQKKLARKFPDIPEHDLHLIIRNLIKPKSWPRRFLLRKLRRGVYVP